MKNLPIQVDPPETSLGEAIEALCQTRDRAIEERDKWNRWAGEQAFRLHVSISNFTATDQPGQWEELRRRIADAIDKLPDVPT